MENNLGDTVALLNQTAGDLAERVSQSDQETERLLAMVEASQRMLEDLSRQLAALNAAVYQRLGLSQPSTTEGPLPSDSLRNEALEKPQGSETEKITPLSVPSEGEGGTYEPGGGAQSENAVMAYQEAQQSYSSRDYATALKQFDDYLTRFPATDYAPNAQFWKAVCYYQLGQERGDSDLLQQAIGEFEKLRTDYPSSSKVASAMLNQAEAHRLLGQTTRAIALLKQLIQYYPTTGAGARAKSRLEELQGN